MKRILFALLFFCSALLALCGVVGPQAKAQTTNPAYDIRWTANCSTANYVWSQAVKTCIPLTTGSFTLTTTGSSGPATYVAGVLNIPVYAGGGFTAAGDLSGTSSSQQVIGLKNILFCSGFTPTNGQFIQLTTGGSPNPCWTSATGSGSGTAVKVNGGSTLATANFANANGINFTNPSGTTVNAGPDGTHCLPVNTGGGTSYLSGPCTYKQVQYSEVAGTPGSLVLSPAPNVNIPFNEGTGTVAHDLSANHNDCTFASGVNAPLWVTGGVNHINGANYGYCSLPASVTTTDATSANSRTITWCGYIRPQTANALATYDVLIGSSNQNGAGTLWMSGSQTPRLQGYLGNYTIGGGLAFGTYTQQPTIGYHCVTVTKGSTTDSTVDHLYIDATEVTYLHQVASWDLRSAGDSDQVGQAAWGGTGTGIAFSTNNTNYVLMYDAVLTPAQVAQNSTALNFLAFQSRGVGLSPPQNFTQSPLLVCNGDSLMNGTPGGVTPPCNSSGLPGLLNKPFSIQNIAVPGTLIQSHVAVIPLSDAPAYSSFSQYPLDFENAGINDLNLGLGTIASVYADRVSWANNVRKLGYQPVWTTMISSTGKDSDIQGINDLLRTTANLYGILIFDFAEEPCLGKTGAYSNPTPCADFQSDGLHESQTGADAMRGIIANVTNWYTGSTIGNPTLITGTTHTIAAGEGYTSVTPSSTTALTLPSCIGYSTTTPFSVYNASTSATVTVAPPGGQNLNGGSGALSIPNAATGKFVVYPLSPTTAGCQWIATVAPAGGGGAVSSVSNSDSTLTVTPTTGAVVASLNLGHANTWTAAQGLPTGSTAVTQTAGDNTTKIATDAYVTTAVAGAGNTNSTSLSTNKLSKANGAHSIVDSSITDDGSTVSTFEPLVTGGYRDVGMSLTSLPLCPNGTSGTFTVAGCNPRRSIAFQYGQPGGSALTAGVMGYITVPFACTITSPPTGPAWSIQVDAGTDTVKFLKVASGTAIPTLGSNSINTSGLSISTGTVIQSTTLSDFTTLAVAAGDILAADLITTSGTGYISVQLTCQ
jgi:hypothetical protein